MVRRLSLSSLLVLGACVRPGPASAAPVEPSTSVPVIVEQEDHVDPAEASAALLAAAARGDFEAVRRYAEVPGVDLEIRRESEFMRDHDTHGYTPLSFAAHHGDVEMFGYLLERGARVKSSHLYAAARGGEVTILATILDLAPHDADDLTGAMVMACASRHRSLIELLRERGAAIDGIGWAGGEYRSTCLIEAVATGDAAFVDYVLEELGADVNAPDEADYSPLMIAVGRDFELDEDADEEERAELAAAFVIIERLLAAGADPHHRSEQAETSVFDLAPEGTEAGRLVRKAAKGRRK